MVCLALRKMLQRHLIKTEIICSNMSFFDCEVLNAYCLPTTNNCSPSTWNFRENPDFFLLWNLVGWNNVAYESLIIFVCYILSLQLGGTVGDIEGMPFIEAFRQFQFRVGRDNFCVVHVSLVPEVGIVSISRVLLAHFLIIALVRI